MGLIQKGYHGYPVPGVEVMAASRGVRAKLFQAAVATKGNLFADLFAVADEQGVVFIE